MIRGGARPCGPMRPQVALFTVSVMSRALQLQAKAFYRVTDWRSKSLKHGPLIAHQRVEFFCECEIDGRGWAVLLVGDDSHH